MNCRLIATVVALAAAAPLSPAQTGGAPAATGKFGPESPKGAAKTDAAPTPPVDPAKADESPIPTTPATPAATTPGSVTPPPLDPANGLAPLPVSLDAKLKARFDTFFQTLKKNDTRFAYYKLLEGSKFFENNRGDIDQLIAQTDQALKQFGKVEDTDLIEVNPTGKSLRELVFITNCEMHPLRWRFVCYYGGGKWQILDLNVTGALEKMFRPLTLVPDGD